MQVPLHLYFIEIKFRLLYFFFSCFSCFIIVFNYHETIFFFSTYSLFFINKGKFITTHIAELFATHMYVSFNAVTFINFPYAYYHCRQFLSSSWYKSQMWFFKNLQIYSFISVLLSLFACYFAILPYAYVFLDTWTITIIHVFQIQLEARIETYIWTTLQTTCLLSNLTYLFLARIIYSFLIDNMMNLHIFYRKNKKSTLFFVCLATSICLPPETIIQILFIISAILLSELFFFITCVFFAKNNV